MPHNSPCAKIVFANPESAIQILRSKARTAFEKERERVRQSLPESHAKQWNRWHRWDGRLVFALSPYSVPPGPERTLWMDDYSKRLQSGQLESMSHLVFDPSAADEAGEDHDDHEGEALFQLVMASDLKPLARPELAPPPPELPQSVVEEVHDRLRVAVSPAHPVGTRLGVFWEDYGQYYAGTILENDGKFALIQYDEGDVLWTRLSEWKHKVLASEDRNEGGPTAAGDLDHSIGKEVEAKGAVSKGKRKKPSAIASLDGTPAAAHPGAKLSLASASSAAAFRSTESHDLPSSTFPRPKNGGAVVAGHRKKRRKTKSTVGTPDERVDPRPCKSSARKLPNGTFSKPRGRPPKGCEFDELSGLYKPLPLPHTPMLPSHAQRVAPTEGRAKVAATAAAAVPVAAAVAVHTQMVPPPSPILPAPAPKVRAKIAATAPSAAPAHTQMVPPPSPIQRAATDISETIFPKAQLWVSGTGNAAAAEKGASSVTWNACVSDRTLTNTPQAAVVSPQTRNDWSKLTEGLACISEYYQVPRTGGAAILSVRPENNAFPGTKNSSGVATGSSSTLDGAATSSGKPSFKVVMATSEWTGQENSAGILVDRHGSIGAVWDRSEIPKEIALHALSGAVSGPTNRKPTPQNPPPHRNQENELVNLCGVTVDDGDAPSKMTDSTTVLAPQEPFESSSATARVADLRRSLESELKSTTEGAAERCIAIMEELRRLNLDATVLSETKISDAVKSVMQELPSVEATAKPLIKTWKSVYLKGKLQRIAEKWGAALEPGREQRRSRIVGRCLHEFLKVLDRANDRTLKSQVTDRLRLVDLLARSRDLATDGTASHEDYQKLQGLVQAPVRSAL